MLAARNIEPQCLFAFGTRSAEKLVQAMERICECFSEACRRAHKWTDMYDAASAHAQGSAWATVRSQLCPPIVGESGALAASCAARVAIAGTRCAPLSWGPEGVVGCESGQHSSRLA